MSRAEAPVAKEQVEFSKPKILAASEIRDITIRDNDQVQVISGKVVIGAKRMIIGNKERVLSGLGIQDEKKNILIDGFGFYGPVDVPGLVVASEILGIGIKSLPDFVVTRGDTLAAYYVTQKDWSEKIFEILESTVQNYPGVVNLHHPELHPLVNRALLGLKPVQIWQKVATVCRKASRDSIPIDYPAMKRAQEARLIPERHQLVQEGLNRAWNNWQETPEDSERAAELNRAMEDLIEIGFGLEVVCDPSILDEPSTWLHEEIKKDLQEGTEMYGRLDKEGCVLVVYPVWPGMAKSLASFWGVNVLPYEGGLLEPMGIVSSRGRISVEDVGELRLIEWSPLQPGQNT